MIDAMQIPQAGKRMDCLQLVDVLPATLKPVESSLQGLRTVIATVDAILSNRSFACLLRAMLAFANWCFSSPSCSGGLELCDRSNFLEPGDAVYEKNKFDLSDKNKTLFKYACETAVRM